MKQNSPTKRIWFIAVALTVVVFCGWVQNGYATVIYKFIPDNPQELIQKGWQISAYWEISSQAIADKGAHSDDGDILSFYLGASGATSDGFKFNWSKNGTKFSGWDESNLPYVLFLDNNLIDGFALADRGGLGPMVIDVTDSYISVPMILEDYSPFEQPPTHGVLWMDEEWYKVYADSAIFSGSWQYIPVSEPSTFQLIGVGLAGIGLLFSCSRRYRWYSVVK